MNTPNQPTLVPPEGPLNILVTKTLTLPEVSDDDLAMIQSAAGQGARVVVVDSPKEGVDHAAESEVLLGITPKWLFEAAPKLRWVHATASGVDMFMYPEFVESPVVLTGEKGLVGSHLADHGFGLLLGLTRRIAMAIKLGSAGWAYEQRERMRFSELELEGMTMGILGFGGTGRHLARRASAFGMTPIALDVYEVEPSDGVSEVLGFDSLRDVVAASDVVAIALPLTADTQGLFDGELFGVMKPTAILLNVTRGEIVDEGALERALVNGTIGGAALDVTPVEPLPDDSPLWELDNCVMTPHTAGASQLRGRRNLERFCRNLEAFRAGLPLEGIVDKRAGF